MKQYSEEQIEMLNRGVRNGLSLDAIKSHPDFRKAGAQYVKDKAAAYERWTADMYLAGGNDGPFASAEQRDKAMNYFVTNDRGRQVRLYDVSPEYRAAFQKKAEQSSFEVMGVYVKPDPLSPTALLRAAQADHYVALKEELFTKSSEKNPNKAEATASRLKLLELAQDPAYQEVMAAFEPPRKPLEEDLKANGPFIIQTFPQGSESQMQAEADRRNLENYNARPGGLGDGGASGEANTTFK